MKQQSSLLRFRENLQHHRDLPLAFNAAGTALSPGYHLTEIKLATVRSLDCSSKADQWDEVIVQLLDGNPASTAGYMNVAKLLSILDRALAQQSSCDSAELYFEFAPTDNTLQKFAVASITEADGVVHVGLQGLQTQCKPFQRMLAQARSSQRTDNNPASVGGSTAAQSTLTDTNSASTCCR